MALLTGFSAQARRRGRDARRDDRLLRDMGLSPEQAFGQSRAFWSEWEGVREPWQL